MFQRLFPLHWPDITFCKCFLVFFSNYNKNVTHSLLRTHMHFNDVASASVKGNGTLCKWTPTATIKGNEYLRVFDTNLLNRVETWTKTRRRPYCQFLPKTVIRLFNCQISCFYNGLLRITALQVINCTVAWIVSQKGEWDCLWPILKYSTCIVMWKTMKNRKDDFHTDFEPYAFQTEASSLPLNSKYAW